RERDTPRPKSGQFPQPPTPNPPVTMGGQGPLARSAEDLELALGVLAGPDVGEDVAWRVELPAARAERLADFRVAVLPPIPWVPVDEEILAAQERVVALLSRLGGPVKEGPPDGLGDHREHHALYRSLLAAATSARLNDEDRRRRAQSWQRADTELARAHARGVEATAAQYLMWHVRREQYRAAYRAFFREWDVL